VERLLVNIVYKGGSQPVAHPIVCRDRTNLDLCRSSLLSIEIISIRFIRSVRN